jgi:hypothetical protein
MAKIILPTGHKWREVHALTSSETCFECERCESTFIHDMMDGSTEFNPSELPCDEDEVEDEVA